MDGSDVVMDNPAGHVSGAPNEAAPPAPLQGGDLNGGQELRAAPTN